MQPVTTKASYPVVLFQVSRGGLELLNRDWEAYPGLTPGRWKMVSQGGWRSLVPEEYHPEVQKLMEISFSEDYTVVEFPVYWQETTVWLLVFAAAVQEPEGGMKIVGLAQDVTADREWQEAGPPLAEMEEADREKTPASLQELCHDISGPLTSILVNCEILLEGDCPDPLRQKAETIFTEALQIDQYLRSYRRV